MGAWDKVKKGNQAGAQGLWTSTGARLQSLVTRTRQSRLEAGEWEPHSFSHPSTHPPIHPPTHPPIGFNKHY